MADATNEDGQLDGADHTVSLPPAPEATAPEESAKSNIELDVEDTGPVSDIAVGAETTAKLALAPPPSAARPPLQRNALQRVTLEQSEQGNAGAGAGPGRPGAAAAPMPHAPAPPLPTDSLSLAQLRKIVSDVNRPEQVAYDFTYADMGAHAEEIDEWFMYQFWQWVRLSSAQKAFEWHWNQETTGSGHANGAAGGGDEIAWEDADHDTHARFVQAAIAGVQSNDAALRSASIGKLVYLVLGRWGDTAMPNATADEDDEDGTAGSRNKGPAGKSVASLMQLQAIKAGVECLASLEGLPVVWEALRHAFELHWSGDAQNAQANCHGSPQEPQDELMNLMTIMYIALQEALNDPEDMSSSYGKLLELQPPLTEFMLTAMTKLRWDEQNVLPQTQIMLLFWKSILLVFGGTKDLQRVKRLTSELSENQDKQVITASPLDYHVFRQEITSKYPAYIPPQPAIPLEEENTSLLPPLPQHSTRHHGANGVLPVPANSQNGGASILHQPVHIATPAPSPPPSPAVGKGGKKQNYQTNQNFPFMYPPLDATSNSAGGKGLAALDDTINRRWEGSDIPASILEAGELFSARVRMTRATRQLWDERERFLKFERGWDAEEAEDDEDDVIEALDLSELTEEERDILKEIKAADKEVHQPAAPEERVDYGPRPQELSERDRQRLAAVESFYHQALPHLQSLVIVLLRPVFANVAAIVSQQGPQMGPGMPLRNVPVNVDNGRSGGEGPELSPEEVDVARTREITTKAMSGIMLLLLKWLRLSHVLRFEYFTQLLLDSNYVPLVLKLLAHQDVQQVVDSKIDRLENSFFQFCNLRYRFKDRIDSDLDQEDEDEDGEEGQANGNAAHEAEAEESDDSAAPPPIKRRRSPPPPVVTHNGPTAEPSSLSSDEDGSRGAMRPEVDELGYPVNDLPMEPITDFSWRNFFSLINYLRVMQKICKGKAHRNLLLVQYKSSTILRKSLRIPQPALRLYTLKLFKNQVPYCGRKWRQSNMRVITAVYLHCRPELRDEWLAGSDIDAEVDSALPLEQALRGLTHWFNVRRYPDKTAGEVLPATAAEHREKQERQEKQQRGQQQLQHDFFTRELERLDLDWMEMSSGEDGMSELEVW